MNPIIAPTPLLNQPVRVIDVGVDTFQQSITAHGGETLHLDWKRN
jgi:hypothetical protein